MLLLLLFVQSAVDVDAPVGCVDVAAVGAAVASVGGIDELAERVSVSVADEDGDGTSALVVDVWLIGAPPLHREAPLRPIECHDVAALVAFLVKSQRELPPEAGGPRRQALPAPDRRLQRASPTALGGRPRDADAWSLCDGPPSCGNLRLTASAGYALPLDVRLAVDVGFDIDDHTTALITAVYSSSVLLEGGVQWRRLIGDVECSARVLVGLGAGLKRVGSLLPTASPELAVRARYGFAFVDAGAYWHILVDESPAAFVAAGLAFAGP